MKLLIYIWRNVTRNKLRSSLTILSVGFSLALMTILYGFLAMQRAAQAEADKHNRLVVLNKVGFAALLPIAHVDRIRQLDSVEAATPFSWFGGNYKGQQMPFAQFGVDPESVFDVFDEYEIAADQVAAFQRERQSCVADRTLAEQMGWQTGERIPLEGTIYPYDLDLRLVGTFQATANTGSLFFNWHYLDEELKKGAADFSGNAGAVYVKCKVTGDVAVVSEEIDNRFANSDNTTRTRTEAAFQQLFADMLGDVQAYIRYISLAVVFALALVAATAMAMSMRERTTEVAVLKAIGFTKTRILSMVLGESTLIALIGGMFGVVGGLAALHGLANVPSAALFFSFPVLSLIGPWLFGMIAVAAAIGFVSGVFPAVLAARLSVVDGLRRVV